MRVLSVGQANQYIKALFLGDPILADVWISGEVSNLSRSAAGHSYWTLKDESGQIKCVLFKREAIWQHVRLENGLSILAHGRVDLYEAAGAYQLYVDLLELQGVGLLYLQFEQLKRRLEADGLFEPERKRPLPPRPLHVGIVTSPTGAVLHDMLQVLSRRCPRLDVSFAPANVQGRDAAGSIRAAIELLNRVDGVEVVIVARGGGSIEDLWCFNEEEVARAVAASRIPVISGVGHETDVTICDLVADVRAATPSVAAELVVPPMEEERREVGALLDDLREVALGDVASRRSETQRLSAALARLSPAYALANRRQRVDDVLADLHYRARAQLDRARAEVEHRLRQLALVDHRAVLSRGYAIVRERAEGRVVTSVAQAPPGSRVDVELRDGTLAATIDAVA